MKRRYRRNSILYFVEKTISISRRCRCMRKNCVSKSLYYIVIMGDVPNKKRLCLEISLLLLSVWATFHINSVAQASEKNRRSFHRNGGWLMRLDSIVFSSRDINDVAGCWYRSLRKLQCRSHLSTANMAKCIVATERQASLSINICLISLSIPITISTAVNFLWYPKTPKHNLFLKATGQIEQIESMDFLSTSRWDFLSTSRCCRGKKTTDFWRRHRVSDRIR